jgi:hypothetical protein
VPPWKSVYLLKSLLKKKSTNPFEEPVGKNPFEEDETEKSVPTNQVQLTIEVIGQFSHLFADAS